VARLASRALAHCSLAIAILFAKVHLYRPFANVWGLWNRNFFALGADWISWSILAFTVAGGIISAMICAWAIGRAASLAASQRCASEGEARHA
jgi:hypothetical protein